MLLYLNVYMTVLQLVPKCGKDSPDSDTNITELLAPGSNIEQGFWMVFSKVSLLKFALA